MARGKHQACWATPTTTIDCVLVRLDRQIEAEGCVLKGSESNCQLAAPDFLVPGDFVKVRLWLDGENTSIHIGLAEVRRIQNHWITAAIRRVTPNGPAQSACLYRPSPHSGLIGPSNGNDITLHS
ncbi:MAG: hypothetical protein K0S79_1785 [Nitrospira sp.]|nr:hypothetical protein [Nitrospira sp.]